MSNAYRSRVVAHGTAGDGFESHRAASRSSSTLRATTGTPVTEHSVMQLRIATDTSHQAKWRLSQDLKRLHDTLCHQL